MEWSLGLSRDRAPKSQGGFADAPQQNTPTWYTATRPLTLLLCLLVRAYQLLISPLLPPRCRFYPTCSSYALQSLQKRALIPALWRITKRILSCHPFHPGGVDLP